MPLGRQCVDHYRILHRYNVFSHDEMVCNMASKADTLDVVLASSVHRDMVIMIREEKQLRDKVKKMVGCFASCYDVHKPFYCTCCELFVRITFLSVQIIFL